MPALPRPLLLLTRPKEDSEAVAARFDVDVIISPILRIEPLAYESAVLEAAQGLVFTSAHAVPTAGPGRGRLAICVGERTAAVARAAGFDVIEGPGTADGMGDLIADSPVPLVHPHGRYRAKVLPVQGVMVYDQVPQPLSALARAALMGTRPVIVPVYSPRSSRLLSKVAKGTRAPIWLVAISDAASEAWTAPAARRIVASHPSGGPMDAAIRLMLRIE